LNYETLYNTIQAYAENTESLFVANIPVFVQEAEQRIYNSVQIPALRKNVTGNLTAGNQYLSLPNDWLSNFSLAVIDSDNKYRYLLNKDVNYLREAYPSVSYSNTTGAYQGTPGGVPAYYSLFGSQLGNVTEMSLMVAPAPDDNYAVEMHYYYYPPTIVKGQVTTIGSLVGGTLYTNGVYQNVALTGGSGANAVADIVVSGQTVVSCNITFGGNFYVVGDQLSCDSIGGDSGSGFLVTVTTVSNDAGTSWLGDNYDPVLFYGAMREAMIFMKGEADMVSYYERMYQESLQQLNRLGTGLERGDAYRDGQARIRQVNP
jgi:hypothetical protein